MGSSVDRAFFRMISMKRIVTGAVSIVLGFGLLIALAVHGSPPPVAALGLLIFFGGGAWTLRDGLRMRRDLRG